MPEEPERGDRRLLRCDGRRLWVATSSRPLLDAAGRRRGLLTTVTDVTERKRVEVAQRLRLDATTSLLQLVGAVLRGQDPGELRDRAAQAAAEVLGAWRVGVFELRRDGALVLCAGRGWRRDDVGSRLAVTLGSPAGLALTCEEPVVVRDAATWHGPPGSLGQDGVGSGCWVGFGGGRGLIAVLEREPRAFAADELRFLGALAGGPLGRRRRRASPRRARARRQRRRPGALSGPGRRALRGRRPGPLSGARGGAGLLLRRGLALALGAAVCARCGAAGRASPAPSRPRRRRPGDASARTSAPAPRSPRRGRGTASAPST